MTGNIPPHAIAVAASMAAPRSHNGVPRIWVLLGEGSDRKKPADFHRGSLHNFELGKEDAAYRERWQRNTFQPDRALGDGPSGIAERREMSH